MKILMVHNYYLERGGEDESFESEAAMLEGHGHDVIRYTRDNRELRHVSGLKAASLALWNESTRGEVRDLIASSQPDIIHCQNTFPLISPSIYAEARRAGAVVVQSLRNYRQICLNAYLFRDGRPCEDCVGKKAPWPGVLHRCYRGSHAASFAVATMLTTHRLLRTWDRNIDIYIANTEFSKSKLIAGGLPQERILVKPNFVDPDPGERGNTGDFALYVGRISPEKGIRTLVDAWEKIEDLRLLIVGAGPLEKELRNRARSESSRAIEMLGRRPRKQVLSLMKEAQFLVFPSLLYETFGRVIIEAFACGVPVLASRRGTAFEIVQHGTTGLHFEAAEAGDLARQVTWAQEHPVQLAKMGRNARGEYEAKYTADRNYELLMDVYRVALARRQS